MVCFRPGNSAGTACGQAGSAKPKESDMFDSKPCSSTNLRDTAKREAALYTRVSSRDQERGGFSIPAQRKLLRCYARDNEIAIAAEFTDVETAGRAGRSEFGAMVRYLRKHPSCTAILV
jgi:hypothetical protein